MKNIILLFTLASFTLMHGMEGEFPKLVSLKLEASKNSSGEDNFYVLSAPERQQREIEEKKKKEEEYAQQQRDAQAERAAEILQKADTVFASKILALTTKLRQYHLLQNISDDLGSIYSGCGWGNHRVSVLSVASVAIDTARMTKKALINRRMQEYHAVNADNYDEPEVVKAILHHEIAITNEKLLEVYDRAYKTL